MIVYFDTSAVIPILIEESTSLTCSRLWDEADRVVSSRLVYAEGRAALAQANRIGRLSDRSLRRAVRDLEGLVSELDVVEVSDQLVRQAGSLAEEHALRGYDAIHLASAELVLSSELVLAAGDRALRQAGRDLGLSVANLDGVGA